jgi:hypothetical protein
MSAITLKTTSGKTVQVERNEIETAAVELFAAIFAENHSVIIWGKTADRFAIVPYNSKLHSDEK